MKTVLSTLCIFLGLLSLTLQAQQSRAFKSVKISLGAGAELAYTESHALLIGNSEYQNGWPQLPGVKKDIQDIRKALEAQGFDVTVVTEAGKQKLDSEISSFISKYGQKPDNRLFLYFAGHGYTVNTAYGDELGYFVPVDAPNPQKDVAGFQEKALEMIQVEIYAKRINAKHALFVFDACFSGSLFALSRAMPENISYKTANPVRQFITSGSKDETVPDESIFNQQFLHALQGEADMDKDGYVTATELGEFLQSSVVNYSRNTQHPQYGKIRNANLDKGDFVFCLATPAGKEIAKPAKTDFDLNELEAKAGNEESLKRAWADKLQSMKKAFEQVKTYESRDIKPELKQAAWDKFITVFSEDNPFSTEDETILAEAKKRKGNLLPVTAVVNSEQVPAVNQEMQLTGDVEIDMIYIKGDTFSMGDLWGEGNSDEKPTHQATVSSFYISKYEVTQKRWKEVMGSTNSPSYFHGDSLPVEQVSWFDAIDFCNKLSMKDGKTPCYSINGNTNPTSWTSGTIDCNWSAKGYRLPTEAEWEFAARSGNKSTQTKYSGSSNIDEFAWYSGNSNNQTHTVGGKKANELGIYDMRGNVWEWCWDWYGSYSSTAEINSIGPITGNYRVLRGGSWFSYFSGCSVTSRSFNDLGGRFNFIGFRVVLPQ